MAMSTVPALALILGRTLAFSVSEGESGWNWSQNPISISAKRFDKMVGIIRSNLVANPIPALRVITDKINQQK